MVDRPPSSRFSVVERGGRLGGHRHGNRADLADRRRADGSLTIARWASSRSARSARRKRAALPRICRGRTALRKRESPRPPNARMVLQFEMNRKQPWSRKTKPPRSRTIGLPRQTVAPVPGSQAAPAPGQRWPQDDRHRKMVGSEGPHVSNSDRRVQQVLSSSIVTAAFRRRHRGDRRAVYRTGRFLYRRLSAVPLRQQHIGADRRRYHRRSYY